MTMIEYNSSHDVAQAQPEGRWRTATWCVPNGNCAEINRERPDRVGVRDSKRPVAALEFGLPAWSRFLDQLKG